MDMNIVNENNKKNIYLYLLCVTLNCLVGILSCMLHDSKPVLSSNRGVSSHILSFRQISDDRNLSSGAFVLSGGKVPILEKKSAAPSFMARRWR
jgi:hypothetical protein